MTDSSLANVSSGAPQELKLEIRNCSLEHRGRGPDVFMSLLKVCEYFRKRIKVHELHERICVCDAYTRMMSYYRSKDRKNPRNVCFSIQIGVGYGPCCSYKSYHLTVKTCRPKLHCIGNGPMRCVWCLIMAIKTYSQQQKSVITHLF